MWRISSRSPPERKHYGLQNQGATCYLNSVLQVLFMTRGFREAVERCSGKFETCLSKLFEDLEKGETHTRSITRELGIRSEFIQGDAAECFENIMNRLNSEASKMFKIELTHKNRCCRCDEERSTDELFWNLPLEVIEKSYTVKVVDGIESFFRESKVTGSDRLYCEKCGTKTNSMDKFEMKRHPDVLTLLLKRFQYDKRSKQYVKIQRGVEIRYTVTIQREKYELYAFVEHSGSLKGGHYTVTIKSEDDQKWYYFSDTFVDLLRYQPFQVDPSQTFWDAYLLFYRREKKTSSQDEANPENSKLGTIVIDPSGNAVKIEEKEDEEATADRTNGSGNDGKSVTVDGETEKKTLTQEKKNSKNKERISVPDELRDNRKCGADEGGETIRTKQPAGSRQDGTKKTQRIYDLVSSQPGNSGSEISDTRHEEEKPTNERENFQKREDELSQIREKKCQRHFSQTAEDENKIQSEGVLHMRSQENLEEETRPGGDSENKLLREEERSRESMWSEHRGKEAVGATADDEGVQCLSNSFKNLKMGDSSSTEKIERRDQGPQTLNAVVSLPMTSAAYHRNTGYPESESQYLKSANCQFNVGKVETDRRSHTQTFIPTGTVWSRPDFPSQTPGHTPGPPHTPFAHPNFYGTQPQRQVSHISRRRVTSNLMESNPCKKNTDHS